MLSMTDEERKELSEKVKEANRQSVRDAAGRGGK